MRVFVDSHGKDFSLSTFATLLLLLTSRGFRTGLRLLCSHHLTVSDPPSLTFAALAPKRTECCT